jgi:high affinity sulfate transporter 1
VKAAQTWVPAWIREYDRSWLRPDAIAGVTVLAYMVPQVLAYSGIVGLPPISGLTTAVVALVLYALLGTSRAVSAGPEATVALMAGLVLAPLIAAHPEAAVGLTATLTLLVGLWLVVGGFARAGVISQLLTPPILTGYLSGEAVLMVASQLGHATRTKVSGSTVPEQVDSFLHRLGDVHLATFTVTLTTVVLLLVLPRWMPRLPAPLTVVLLGTAVNFLMSDLSFGLQELGAIPRGIPPMTAPTFDAATLGALLVGSLGIALLSFSDVMLVARAFAKPGEEVDANRELFGVAAVHIVSAFGGGYPSSASSSRTALGRGAGQRTQLSGLVTAAGIVLVVLIFGPLLEHLPQATLAGLVIWAGAKLISIADYRHLWRFRRSEFAIAVMTALGTALLGILPGIGIAVALSALQILVALSRPHEAIQGFAVGVAGLHDVDDYPAHVTVPGLLIYRYDGPLIAYNRHDFQVRLTRAVLDENPRWVLLNVEANMLVDYSACEMLHQVISGLQAQGRTVALARLKHDLETQLQAAGIMRLIGDHRYETLPQAIKAYHEANPDIALPPIPAPGEPFDPGGPTSLG